MGVKVVFQDGGLDEVTINYVPAVPKPIGTTGLDFTEVIGSVRNIKNNNNPLTDDMLPDGTAVFKVKYYKAAYESFLRAPNGISAIRGLLFRRGATPLSRTSMTGDCLTPFTLLKRGKKVSSIVALTQHAQIPYAYLDFLPIKAAKLKDVKDLLRHVTLSSDVVFYSNLRSREDNEEVNKEVVLE